MKLVDVQPCDTPSCEAHGSFEIVDRGMHHSWHCGDCIAIIELILEETSRMVKLGTPRNIAADWASAAVGRIA